MDSKFDGIDIFVFIAILVISVLIGLYCAYNLKITKALNKVFKRKTEPEHLDEGKVSGYLIANSSMGALPIAFSLLATFFSATALIGYPAEVYVYGIERWTVTFGTIMIPPIGAFLTGPFFLRLKVMSVFEYFKLRYDSNNVRLVGMLSYVVKSIIAAGIFVYGPATSLYSLTKIDERIGIAVIGFIGTFYTTLGGIKAVIWTDFFQALIMLLSTFIIFIKGIVDIGGFSNLWEISLYGGQF